MKPVALVIVAVVFGGFATGCDDQKDKKGTPLDGGSTEGDPPVDDPPKSPPTFNEADAGCVVTNAIIKSAVPADAPLQFPQQYTPPKPNSAPPNNTGAIAGTITAPPALAGADFIGFGFEYHSDLNHRHGCFSQQYKKDLTVDVSTTTKKIVRIAMDADSTGKLRFPGLLVKPWYRDKSDFSGNTHTGIRRIAGAPVYQGTPDVIHWVDPPGLQLNAGVAAPGVVTINIVQLKSVTWDADAKHGWQCDTMTTAVVDDGTRKPLLPLANAKALMNAVDVPAGVAPAALPLNRQAISIIRAVAQYMTSNPEFAPANCTPF